MTKKVAAVLWLIPPAVCGCAWASPQVLAAPIADAQDIGTEEVPVWHWGQPEPSGLVLGVCEGERRGGNALIGGVIANHGAQDATFNSYFVGKDEAVTVRARAQGETEWKEVSWLDPEMIGRAGIGPQDKDVRTLKSGEQFLPHTEFKPVARFSFSIFASRYKWPQSKGLLEIQIEQWLYSAGGGTPLEHRLLSGTITLDAAELQPPAK